MLLAVTPGLVGKLFELLQAIKLDTPGSLNLPAIIIWPQGFAATEPWLCNQCCIYRSFCRLEKKNPSDSAKSAKLIGGSCPWSCGTPIWCRSGAHSWFWLWPNKFWAIRTFQVFFCLTHDDTRSMTQVRDASMLWAETWYSAQPTMIPGICTGSCLGPAGVHVDNNPQSFKNYTIDKMFFVRVPPGEKVWSIPVVFQKTSKAWGNT